MGFDPGTFGSILFSNTVTDCAMEEVTIEGFSLKPRVNVLPRYWRCNIFVDEKS